MRRHTMPRSLIRSLLLVLALSGVAHPAWAAPQVVASIKPIHALVASVMQGVGSPALLLEGAASPHTYSLKPSDAAKLEHADVVFWVGPDLEAFLAKPLDALAAKATRVELMQAPGLTLLPVRTSAGFAQHDEHEHGEDGSGTEAHSEQDPHIWLDPRNAMAMTTAIAASLEKADPANAATYESNAKATLASLQALDATLEKETAAARGKGFLVFHDAYQYFEHRYGLQATRALAIHPENPPGAAALKDIRNTLADGDVVCAFSEPQFDDRLLRTITEGTTVRTGVLDPLGAEQTAGPALYEVVLRNVSQALVGCLSSK